MRFGPPRDLSAGSLACEFFERRQSGPRCCCEQGRRAKPPRTRRGGATTLAQKNAPRNYAPSQSRSNLACWVAPVTPSKLRQSLPNYTSTMRATDSRAPHQRMPEHLLSVVAQHVAIGPGLYVLTLRESRERLTASSDQGFRELSMRRIVLARRVTAERSRRRGPCRWRRATRCGNERTSAPDCRLSRAGSIGGRQVR